MEEIKKVEKYQFSTDLARDPWKITKRITREYENDKNGGRKVINQEMKNTGYSKDEENYRDDSS